MREEFWKDVMGFDGIYQISNLGNVRKIVDGGFRYKSKPEDGRIELYKDGERTRYSINLLLYEHFGIPSEEGEIWADIEGEDYVKISNMGRLYNIKTGHFIGYDPNRFPSISKLVVKAFGLPTEDGEEWRDIIDHEDYQVSNLGRVRNAETGRILKQYWNGGRKRDGYLRVDLRTNKKTYKLSVHRLVALAFIPNPDPENLIQVNHKDENKSNNHADNLEWCDATYNINYGTRSQRMSETIERKRKAKLDKCKTEEERQNVLKAQDYADASRRYYWKHKK